MPEAAVPPKLEALVGPVGGPARSIKPSTARVRNPEAVRMDILRAAANAFARHGLAGARVDDISAATKTSKTTLYYHFGSKEALFREVLRQAYINVREGELGLDLASHPPLEALAKLVAFTFDHHGRHIDFITLVMDENIHGGINVRQIQGFGEINAAAIAALSQLCERGAADGSMRKDIDPVDLHMSISALSFFNVSNRHTFEAAFGCDMVSDEARARRRETVVDLILGHVRRP